MLKFKLECYKNIRNNTILKPWSDDLTLGWLIRTICRFVSRTCRMIWPYAGWFRLVQKPVSGLIGLTGLAQSSAMVLWSWGKCLLKNIFKWVLTIGTSLGTFIVTVSNSSTISIIEYYLCALTKFVSKLAMFIIEPSALYSRYSKS